LATFAAYGYGGYGGYSGYGGSSGSAPMLGTTHTLGKVLGASTYYFSAPLSQGLSHASVKELQERLRAEGFFTFPTSTGFFGPITLAAVKAYQTAHGIPSTGYVGRLTLAELNK